MDYVAGDVPACLTLPTISVAAAATLVYSDPCVAKEFQPGLRRRGFSCVAWVAFYILI